MKNLLTILFLTIPFLGFTQQNEVEVLGDFLNYNLFNEKYKKVKGTPYVQEEFEVGLFSHNNKTYSVRYDAYNEVMQVKLKEDKLINLQPKLESKSKKIINNLPNLNYTITISSSKKTYVPISYPDKLNNSKSFGVLLWSNDGKHLIKREFKGMNAAKETKAYQRAAPASFTSLKEKYYYSNSKEDIIIEVSQNKKKLFEELFDEETKNVAKNEKLNPKSEKDLIRLFEIYFGK